MAFDGIGGIGGRRCLVDSQRGDSYDRQEEGCGVRFLRSAFEWELVATRRPRIAKMRPDEGDVVAWRFAAWRVDHVQDATPTEEEEQRLAVFKESARPSLMPYRVTLVRLHGQPAKGESKGRPGWYFGRVAAASAHRWSVYAKGRVPLCSCCGDPFPCRTSLIEAQVEEAVEDADRVERIGGMSGCQACGEPITARQGAVVFPEPDVRVPFGAPPRFHTRRACAQGAAVYEEKRQASLGARARVVDRDGRPVTADQLATSEGGVPDGR